jgi:hypothetical protein
MLKFKSLLLALTVTGGAALAFVLAARQTRLPDDVEHRLDLQEWETDGGSVPPAVKPSF